MKVCDNVYLTKAAISLQVPCFPSQFSDFHSECFDPSYSKHTTLQFFTLQSYVFASIFVFQGLIYALLGQQRRKKKKKVLLREKSLAFTIYLAQCTRNTKLILKIQVPGCSPGPPTGIITATGIQIVLCCTWTIHKGYYIVLHSFPFLQLSLVYVRAHFTFIFFSSTGVQKHF